MDLVNVEYREYEITPAHCQRIADRTRKISGVRIDTSKTDFIRLRLSHRLRTLGVKTFDAYLDRLESDTTGVETRLLAEALATHTTDFFRERHQYDWLAREGLASLKAGGIGHRHPLVVWSAACSTGAELWSAGMLIAESEDFNAVPGRVRLIGSDLSKAILRKAAGATYTEDEIGGLSAERKTRFLLRSKTKRDPRGRPYYRIDPELRGISKFLQANLLDTAPLRSETMDIVFLRNVLIYFDRETQDRVLTNVISLIRPGGILFTGHAEPVKGRSDLVTVSPSVYRKR
ncbi:CheR family methyltransferase [Chachezhania sediminis]|uniref:CheR family methyltransferase n=1 Tax=Chachezhania sediminis TaxID=2599291 RepID=UPI00131E25B4|nr:CheR family methyltransferase [Chachezhania sediminis]